MLKHLIKLLFFCLLSGNGFSQTSYEVIDLGTLGGSISQANGINDSSQIVGVSQLPGNLNRAFLWDEGTMTDLGTLIGYSGAFKINNLTQVVGTDFNIGGGASRGFLWDSGVMIDLGNLGGVYTGARSINDSTQIVGGTTLSDNSARAFLWQNGNMIDLGTLSGDAAANCINNLAQVVGFSDDGNGTLAFLWENGQMTDLGSFGGIMSTANGINELSQIVGTSTTPSGSAHAFLWVNGTMQDLGTLTGGGSGAWAINDSSQIVGYYSPVSGGFRACIWHSGAAFDLNTLIPSNSGWILEWARDINNKGEIVGHGSHNGQTRGFLLRPRLRITSPIAGEKWIAGETDTIRWTGNQSGQLLDLEYSTDNGNTYSIIKLGVLADSGSYAWKVPKNILSTKVKIKLTDVVDTLLSIASGTFKIKPYLLTRMNSNGNYDAYSKFRDPYSFGNDSMSVWPIEFWENFDYTGTDPFTGFNYLVGVPVWLLLQTSSSDHPDWVSWVRTFGVSACYYNTSFPPVYSRTALVKWIDFSDEWGGSCFGISTSNVLLFNNTTAFLNNYQSFPTSDPILIQPIDSVRTVINELFTHQFGLEHLTYRGTIGLQKSPNQTLREIKTMLLDDDPLIRTLSIVSNDPTDPGGHSIMAYKVEQDTTLSNIFYVFTYDNAYPNNLDSAIIVVDTLANSNNGTWTPIYGWQNWGGTKWFYLRDPAINYFLTPSLPKNHSTASPFILGDNELQIINTRKSSIKITDQIGNTSGFINGVLLDDIPNCIPNIIENGSSGPPIGYDLMTDDYSIQMSDYEDSNAFISFYSENKTFRLFRNDVDISDNDRFFFDGGVSAVNPDAQNKTISLLNLINETTQEKLVVVSSIELAQNDSVKIENPDSNKVKLISYGSAKDYDIDLNYSTANGIGRFANSGISLTANTSHTLLPDWANLTNSQLIVLVDVGNDGTIDDTLHLNNTVDVKDEGNLLTPTEFNLAQNYPNPFNPTTTIRYSITQRSTVVLKVYDVLGNEVGILVDEEKERGVYSVNFDASQLASGIYFYRLQAGSFVETKKMILLK